MTFRPGSVGVALAAVVVGVCGSALLLDRPVERLSLVVSLRLASEVTAICLVVSLIAVYLAYRHGRLRWLPPLALFIAVGSLLVPTLARSLSFASLLSYYGPVAGVLRGLGWWPADRPLDSSHLAVVLALVTLYLPIVLVLVAGGVRGLGRLPDVAGQLGSAPIAAFFRVALPGVSSSLLAAGLIVFSQVLGVIVTPRILGSREVTLPMLIDDLLKRELHVEAALRLAVAELALAIPLAVIAALLLRRRLRVARRTLRPASRSIFLSLPLALLVLLLSIIPLTLIALAFVDSPILALGEFGQRGLTTRWFGEVLSGSTWWKLIVPSLLTGGTALVLSLSVAAVLMTVAVRFVLMRAVTQWAALVLLFIPHNALGVVLSIIVDAGGSAATWLPGWFLGGAGQALPALAITLLLIDRSLDRLRGPLRVAATLGAGRLRRLRLVVLPNLVPALMASLVATVLITLDDVIFIRYLPREPVSTFATELFARARYSSSPELAAVCTLILAWVVALAGVAIYFAERKAVVQGVKWRRPGKLALAQRAPDKA